MLRICHPFTDGWSALPVSAARRMSSISESKTTSERSPLATLATNSATNARLAHTPALALIGEIASEDRGQAARTRVAAGGRAGAAPAGSGPRCDRSNSCRPTIAGVPVATDPGTSPAHSPCRPVFQYVGVDVVQNDDISLLEGMATTRAIRRFRPDPIPETDLATMFWHASRAPSGSNRQPFRFLVLRDGPRAREARALLGEAFRAEWVTKRAADGYDAGSGIEAGSRKARMANAMQQFVDRFEETPVIVLACHEPYRPLSPFDGANVYPACQNLLLAARALGYGGVMTMWHVLVDDELRADARHLAEHVHRSHDGTGSPGGIPRSGSPAAARRDRVRGQVGRAGLVGGGSGGNSLRRWSRADSEHGVEPA